MSQFENKNVLEKQNDREVKSPLKTETKEFGEAEDT